MILIDNLHQWSQFHNKTQTNRMSAKIKPMPLRLWTIFFQTTAVLYRNNVCVYFYMFRSIDNFNCASVYICKVRLSMCIYQVGDTKFEGEYRWTHDFLLNWGCANGSFWKAISVYLVKSWIFMSQSSWRGLYPWESL